MRLAGNYVAKFILIIFFCLLVTQGVWAEGAVPDLIQKGDNYLRNNNIDQAISVYTEAINAEPKSPLAYAKRGLAFYSKNQNDLAFNDFNSAIDKGSKDGGVYLARGKIHFLRYNYDQALEDFSKAIEYEPKLAAAYTGRGIIYTKLDKHELAIADLNEAIRLNDPELFTAYYNRGMAYFLLMQLDPAIADFSKCIDLRPDNAAGYSLRGMAYFWLGNPQLAVADYNTAIQLRPNVPDIYLQLSKALEYAGQVDEAIAAEDIYLKKTILKDDFDAEKKKRRLKYLYNLKESLNNSRGLQPKLPESFKAADGNMISGYERQAIISGVELMDAYNSRDNGRIRAIDLRARYMMDEEVAYLSHDSRWTLFGVEVLAADTNRMQVKMIYSGSSLLYKATLVSLYYLDGMWRIANHVGYDGVNAKQLAREARKAKLRYGVPNLMAWPGLKN